MAAECYNINDHYLPASFNAVPFEALDVTSEHGRRGAEGEFVFGEQTGYVDLGRKIRTYSISGRIAENAHVLISELLIRMAERRGPGILVHPTRGILRVACKSLRIHDNPAEEAGVTTFDADFVEANVLGSALGGILSSANIGIQAIMTVSAGNFKEHFLPGAGFYRSAIIGAAASAAAAVAQAYGAATLGAQDSGRWAVLAEFKAVGRDPQVLASADNTVNIVQNGLSLIDKDGLSAAAKIEAYRSVVNACARVSALPAPANEQENAVYAYARLAALCYLIQETLAQTPENMESGLSAYARISAVLEEELNAAQAQNEPELYLALSAFAAEARQKLLARAYSAGALVEYDVRGALPALAAAWEIYGDAKRAGDIARQNGGLPWAAGPKLIAEAE